MKTIKQEKQSDIELHSYTPDHVTITQHDQFSSDEVVIEKAKIPEFVAAIHPDLEREKEEFAMDFAEWFHVMRDAGELSRGRFTNDEIFELYKNRDNGKN